MENYSLSFLGKSNIVFAISQGPEHDQCPTVVFFSEGLAASYSKFPKQARGKFGYG